MKYKSLSCNKNYSNKNDEQLKKYMYEWLYEWMRKV